jgi:hypothetical protein
VRGKPHHIKRLFPKGVWGKLSLFQLGARGTPTIISATAIPKRAGGPFLGTIKALAKKQTTVITMLIRRNVTDSVA